MSTYYERNREKVKAAAKARYEANKELASERNKAWKAANPEKFKESQRKWLDKNPVYYVYRNAKRRAKELDIPFDLEFSEMGIPDRCEASGVLFNYSTRESSPSLDRVCPSLGYTKDNVRFITMRLNRIKNDGSESEHRLIADYIAANSLGLEG